MNCGWRAARTGPHSTCAESGTAIPAASQRGTTEGIHEAIRAASKTIPRVARTESRNPTFNAMLGSSSSRVTVATQRKVRDRPLKPPTMAARPTLPMTEARRTLGSGPTRTTKAISPHTAIAPATGRLTLRHLANRMKPPSSKLQFAPLTAVRCVIPVVFISASRLSGSALVSPVTIPGIRPAGSEGNHAEAATNCLLASAADWRTSKPEAMTTGADDADKRAACSCPSRTVFNVPEVLTICPGCTSCQPLPPTTITSAEPCVTEPLDVTLTKPAATDHRFPPEWPGADTSAGTPVIRTSRRTPFPSATALANGPPSCVLAVTAQLTATAAPRTDATARDAEIVLARGTARRCRHVLSSSNTTTSAKTPASAADHAAAMRDPAQAMDQVTSTAGTSLKSARFDEPEPPRVRATPATPADSATLDRHKFFEGLHEFGSNAVNGVKFIYRSEGAMLFPPVNDSLRSHGPHSG